MNTDRRHKWWGWGSAGTRFDASDRPAFWPWVRSVVTLPERPVFPPMPREQIRLPPRRIHAPFEDAAVAVLGGAAVRGDDEERLRHAYGRSLRDLIRLRACLFERVPDLILYPSSHDQVATLVELAVEHDVCLIPFGGGTNITGCVEAKGRDDRVVVTLDLAQMNRLLAVDRESCTARFEAGVFGPDLETALAQHGLTLGHQPDSFQFSTLGGWLATRSAGTLSNAYGKIEDMVLSLRVVTPSGTIETRTVPACASGPDINRLLVGSEGVFGVITEAVVRVHPLPQFEDYRLMLFRSFPDGLAALRACQEAGCLPSLARLSDPRETELVFACRHATPGWKRWLQAPLKAYLRRRGYAAPCAAVIAFEGPARTAATLHREAMRILRRFGAVDLGTGPGNRWRHSRYDLPYLRDYLLDYNLMCDSMETATVWSNLLPLVECVREATRAAATETTGQAGYIGCHLSHFYPTGACVYFLFGAAARPGSSPESAIEQYAAIKARGTAAILAAGGTLTHHHSVGFEHLPWMTVEHSPAALNALRAVKAELDPTNLMNPGSLLPPAEVPLANGCLAKVPVEVLPTGTL